jgi:hypothetical protein
MQTMMSTKFRNPLRHPLGAAPLAALLGASGCGGPKDIPLPDLGVTVTAPDGWSVEMARASSIGAGGAELKKDGKTYGFIDPKVVITLGADAKAWPKDGPHTLEQLQAAFAPLQPESPESFERGFGLRYAKQGKPHFQYVIVIDGKELSCTANDHIAEADVADAISICKSIRP